jgi:hypothetical protein
MKSIAIFKRLGEPYDPIQKEGRPWLSHLKRDIVSPEESMYYYIKYKYPNIKVVLITRNNLSSKVDYLNKNFDIVFAAFEELTLPFKEFAKKGKFDEYEIYVNAFKSIKNLYPKYEYIEFIMDKCKYYNYLKRNSIPVVPTRCFKLSSKTSSNYIKRVLIDKDWKRVFIKPIPGLESTDLYNFKDTNLVKNNFKNAIYDLKNKKYKKLVIQKYMKNFATTDFPELRTFWLNKDYQYTISTTSYGYDWKLIKSPVDKFIMKNSVHILNMLEKKFKQKMLLTRIDWGYDKNIGYFVNEIEYAPGLFTETFNSGDNSYKLDTKYAKLLVELVH